MLLIIFYLLECSDIQRYLFIKIHKVTDLCTIDLVVLLPNFRYFRNLERF